MARAKSTTDPGESPPPRTAGDDEAAALKERRRNRRETIESFVVVVIGFLVWSLEAEGFVIPTGSMAPTLLGRHKEVDCPHCGWTYRVNADCEVESTGAGAATGLRVTWGVCENCRIPSRIDHEPSFAGDRIYTLKTDAGLPFPTVSNEPRRWDVTVFKLPENPTDRYIKRLVGLPGEVVRIRRGDLWRAGLDDGSPFEILRRPAAQSLQVNIPVYDDAYRPARLEGDPQWKRWWGWEEPSRGVYRASAPEGAWSELRYRHLVPSPGEAEAIAAGPPPAPPGPSLVTDFCSFNTDLVPENLPHVRYATRPWFQPHWVGDLAISMRLRVSEPSGRFRVDLVEGGTVNRCEIDLSTGTARLTRDDAPLGEPASTPVKAGGAYDLTFANIDDRLTLWVDGKLPFGEGVAYNSHADGVGEAPTREDLEPVRVAVDGGSATVDRLVVKRDVYYTQDPGEPDSDDLLDYRIREPESLFELLRDPGRYAELRWRTPREFPIEEGRYLMLGDNSPWSRDGRAWTRVDQTTRTAPDRGWSTSGRESWEVPREQLIGKAFVVYWPHFRPVWPRWRLGPDLILPARPNVESVRWIY